MKSKILIARNYGQADVLEITETELPPLGAGMARIQVKAAGINPIDARLGNAAAELSPKFLLVAPEQRLSWQVHERRAERWVFLNDGGYYRSLDPENPGELIKAHAGSEVQFAAGECHRLVGGKDGFTLVAEIWQHTDPSNPSNEDDIVRLADDYSRADEV